MADKLVRMYVGAKVPLETISRCENLDWFEGRMGDIAVRVWNPADIWRGLYRIDIHLACGSGGTTMLIDPVTLERDGAAEEMWWLDYKGQILADWMDSVGAERAHKTVDSRFKEVACG